jgi:hypothetical protein
VPSPSDLDEPTRRLVITAVLMLQDRTDLGMRATQRQNLDEWLAHSPLAEIVFDDKDLMAAPLRLRTAARACRRPR